MHILFLTHYFPPEVNAPATRTWEHCRRWVAAGHRVTVITCAPNCPTGVVFVGYRNRWKTEERVDGIRVIRVWTWLASNRGFFGRVVNYVSYMLRAVLSAVWLRNVDVVVATSPQFFCGWAGVLCRWVRRWPFVLEIRDLWPESIVTVGAMRRSRVIRLLEFLERRMYATADHIVTVGDGYRQELIERGVPDEKISVVPNGVDLDEFAAPVRPVRRGSPDPAGRATAGLPTAVKQTGDLRSAPWHGQETMPQPDEAMPRPGEAMPQRPFVCGYLGTVGMAHGLEVVLDAAQTLQRRDRRDVVFEIVGDGAERERLEAEVRRRGLTNVRFTGMVSKADVPAVLAGFDAALVHLRGTELFGTVIPSKIFEALALQVPIIMGVRGQARDIVLAGDAGVAMTPDDADSLLECIDAIQADPGAFRGGRSYVERHFDRRDLAARMLHILERIADPEHARTVPISRRETRPPEAEPSRRAA